MTVAAAWGQVGALRGLQRLDVTEPYYYDHGHVLLIKALAKSACPELKHLTLSSRHDMYFKGFTAVGATQLAEAIEAGAFPALEVLDISGNSPGEAGARALGEALSLGKCPNLRALNMGSSRLGPGTKYVVEGAAFLPELRELDVSFNVINPWVGAKLKFEGLTGESFPSLRVLTMMSVGMEEAAARCLGQAMQKGAFPSLEVLQVSNNRIGDGGATSFFEAWALGGCPNLRQLSFDRTEITSKTCEALAEALQNHALPRLETLNLSNNVLGRAGARSLARALAEVGVPALRRVDLQQCELFKEGREALVFALESGRCPAMTDKGFHFFDSYGPQRASPFAT
jgi:Ran GTPase-activating protein (RanGAP) involved in mRNA processing and transport